jgi:hypothetical protein
MLPVLDEAVLPRPPDLRHLLAHGPEAQDATGCDDGALHARKGPMNEGQVKGHQGGIWTQLV